MGMSNQVFAQLHLLLLFPLLWTSVKGEFVLNSHSSVIIADCTICFVTGYFHPLGGGYLCQIVFLSHLGHSQPGHQHPQHGDTPKQQLFLHVLCSMDIDTSPPAWNSSLSHLLPLLSWATGTANSKENMVQVWMGKSLQTHVWNMPNLKKRDKPPLLPSSAV